MSVMISLFDSVGNLSKKPVTNIGFPFKYYYQFWLSKSDSPNCGWNVEYFIYDFLIILIFISITYYFIKKYQYHLKENNT